MRTKQGLPGIFGFIIRSTSRGDPHFNKSLPRVELKMTMSSTVVKTEVTAEDCDPPSPLEGHLIMLPDSPLSDCDSQSFTTTGSCVTRCANDKPFQDISNKKSSTARELVSIIKQGRLEDLVYLLESKPNTDLNTFVNGNTALHYCLMLGKLCG